MGAGKEGGHEPQLTDVTRGNEGGANQTMFDQLQIHWQSFTSALRPGTVLMCSIVLPPQLRQQLTGAQRSYGGGATIVGCFAVLAAGGSAGSEPSNQGRTLSGPPVAQGSSVAFTDEAGAAPTKP